jgi:hypothetical protein
MTTTDDQVTAIFGRHPSWCTATNEGHLDGIDDGLHDADQVWKRAHHGESYRPVPDGGWDFLIVS